MRNNPWPGYDTPEHHGREPAYRKRKVLFLPHSARRPGVPDAEETRFSLTVRL